MTIRQCPATWAADPGAPTGLKCEYQAHPLAVDTPTPRLSWLVNDSRRSSAQTAYQILVAGTREALAQERGDIWDSGRVAGHQSVHVAYAGPPLSSATAYFWKVRTWDADGAPSAYSRPGVWEMGLLEQSDWTAQWIAADDGRQPGPGDPAGWRHGKWIWHPTEKGDGQRVLLRKAFELPNGAISKAQVRCTADDRFTLWVNGTQVGEGDSWGTTYDFDVTTLLRPGSNLIAVAAANVGGPCGFRLAARVDIAGAQPVWLLSDGTWRTEARQVNNWTALELDDAGWPQAQVLGDWGAEPWGTGGPAGEPLRAMMARHEFTLTAPAWKARVHVCGLGAYELRINGLKVGEDRLTPGWTEFGSRVQYQTYDVTDLLKQGANALGMTLGSGWWHGRIGGGRGQRGRDALRLILQMDIDCGEAGPLRVVSDPSWRFHPSPIVADSIYDGESYDARLATPGWDSPGFDDSAWIGARAVSQPTSNLVPQAKEPIRVFREFEARVVTQPSEGVFVFDFGQNLVGWTRLQVNGKSGDTVVLRHAEVLKPDGDIYTDNLRSAKATDTYVLGGVGPEVYEPRFTYHGFRYVQVTGYPGRPSRDALIACAATSATPAAGTFECANELINQIQHNILWGQYGNMYSVPTDCPQRDERLGWTGDAQMFCPTSCYNANMARLYTKWMRDIADCQREDGAVLDVNPANGGGPAAPAWGDACIIVPWVVYQHYGDTRILQENWDCMVRWVQYMDAHLSEGLYERNGYGDWIAVVPSPKKPISAAYYIQDIRLMGLMAKALGKDDEALKYERMLPSMEKAFNERYLDEETGVYQGGTQTAAIIPLQFGLVPDGQLETIARLLADDIISRGVHLTTGFLGTGYINPVLTDSGYHDLAWRLATQSTYPSWGYMAKQGATTIWELWNSDRAGPGMNSRNHFCLGAVGEWFFEALAGIAPRQPGFGVSEIRPRPAGDLQWVKASLETMYGRIVSNWRLQDGDLLLDVTVPANTTAFVTVPVFGKLQAQVTEGGRATPTTVGQQAQGIRLVRADAEGRTFEVGSGVYEFVAHGIGTPPTPQYALPPVPPRISELSDDFDGAAIDDAKWQVIDLGLESRQPSGIKAGPTGGALQFEGATGVDYWAGKTLMSRGAFDVDGGRPLQVSVRRLALQAQGSGARSSLWLWVDPLNYIMFSQDTEQGHWSYNLDGRRGPGVPVLDDTDPGPHEMRLMHDGASVAMILDGKELARVPVSWRDGIRVALTGQARKSGDRVMARFDDLAARLLTPR